MGQTYWINRCKFAARKLVILETKTIIKTKIIKSYYLLISIHSSIHCIYRTFRNCNKPHQTLDDIHSSNNINIVHGNEFLIVR